MSSLCPLAIVPCWQTLRPHESCSRGIPNTIVLQIPSEPTFKYLWKVKYVWGERKGKQTGSVRTPLHPCECLYKGAQLLLRRMFNMSLDYINIESHNHF